MLALLDANSLVADPFLRGLAWRALVKAPAHWALQVATTEVAVLEAAALLSRKAAETRAAARSVMDRASRLGVQVEASSRERLSDDLHRLETEYETTLRDLLCQAGVTVLDFPRAHHRELVGRAVKRRRPCNHKGDGYRDTLMWLTILEYLDDHAEEAVLLVTQDGDFRAEDDNALHPHLLEDLELRGATGRVLLLRTLEDLVFTVADAEVRDLELIEEQLVDGPLREEAVALLAHVVGTTVSPRRCGLPTDTTRAVIASVAEVAAFELGRSGRLGEDAVVSFVASAETSIELTRSTDGGESAAHVDIKPLEFQGILQLDRFHRVDGGEITEVSAHLDDEGLGPWRVLDVLEARQVSRNAPFRRAVLSDNASHGISLTQQVVNDNLREVLYAATFPLNQAASDAVARALAPLNDAVRKALSISLAPVTEATQRAIQDAFTEDHTADEDSRG